jgi:hypothetical protein
MAAGRDGSPSQWGAVSPAEAIRAEPATVAAAHAGLCRSADAIGDRLRCRVGVLRAGVLVRVKALAPAGVLVRAEAVVRAGVLVRAEAVVRAGVLVRAGVPVRAADRDGLRCRAEARDT